MKRRHLLALWLALSPAAHADDALLPALQLSGFATLGAVMADRGDLHFYGADFNDPARQRVDYGADSVIGLQGSLRLSKASDLTVQMTAKRNPHGDHRPQLSWAFFRHSPAEGVSVRAGRLRVPFFMFSDTLRVNYAHPWVRPPTEVYSLNPFASADGIDMLVHASAGAWSVELQPYYGGGSIDLLGGGKARLHGVRGINLTASRDALSVHLGHGQGRLAVRWKDSGFRALSAALALAGPAYDTLADELSGRRGRAAFTSFGVHWDDGRHQLIGEYVRRRSDRYVDSAHAWYLSAGYRAGSVLPYVVLASQRQDHAITSLAPPAALQGAFDAYLASRSDAQRSLTLGLRWDLDSALAFKAQLTHARIGRQAWGSFYPEEGGRAPGGRRVNVLSVAIDMVF